MNSEALYEQYKEALKRGHVAVLRGHMAEALFAYAEAARIAPERSTPHTSAGAALLRHKRPADALRHYEVALSVSPRDEAALLGRAQALAALDRRGEAADAFDSLADVQSGVGRLADAVDAARRGLELAEGRERRRTLARLIARLRATEPGEPGRLALERALQVLDGLAVPHPKPADGIPVPSDGAMPATAAEPVTPEANIGVPAGAVPPVGDGLVGPAADQVEAAPEQLAEAAPAPGVQAESESAPAPAVPEPRQVPAGATAAGLAARAEAAVGAGVPEPAVEALLDLAALHSRDGRIEAALEACYSAVSFDPDSVALHLMLVELYSERGWDGLAAAKLDLLERLAHLDGDDRAVADIAGVRAART